jgi:hypothetical protein
MSKECIHEAQTSTGCFRRKRFPFYIAFIHNTYFHIELKAIFQDIIHRTTEPGGLIFFHNFFPI